MSLNKKGFVLIETLSVTIFAATIFVFLFKSVVPIMGLYDTKIDQLGNIDAAYNNYHVRQLVYDDDCFNNTCEGNYNADGSRSSAIKDMDYTMIRCDDKYINTLGLTGSDKHLYSKLNSSDYCNKLMEAIGGREQIDVYKKKTVNGNQEEVLDYSYYLDHYWIFYVKGSALKDDEPDFLLQFYSGADKKRPQGKYYSYGKTKTLSSDYIVQGTQFGEETYKLFRDAIKDLKSTKNSDGNPKFKESDSYLIFYYWYKNPVYTHENNVDNVKTNEEDNKKEKRSVEPKYKDAISIVNIKSSSENLYCFKLQVVPSSTYFYRNTNSGSKTYFYFDEKYLDTKKYIGDAMEKCMYHFNGKRRVIKGQEEVLGSTNVEDYCKQFRNGTPAVDQDTHQSFSTMFLNDSQKDCERDMENKSITVNVVSSDSSTTGNTQEKVLTKEEATAYCVNLLKYHNQAYSIYQFINDSTFNSNCVHYFSSYDSIQVRGTEGTDEGKPITIAFNECPTDAQAGDPKCVHYSVENFCSNRFYHYNLGTIWDDFINARIGMRGFQYVGMNNAELAIVDYDSNCSKDVVIPDVAYNDMKITVIGQYAFKDKGIRTVKMGGNVKVIDKGAFDGNYYNPNSDITKWQNKGIKVVKY